MDSSEATWRCLGCATWHKLTAWVCHICGYDQNGHDTQG